MANSKGLLPGSAGMLLLQLLSEGDLYGYQMTEELRRRSDDTFVTVSYTHLDVYKRQG